MILPIDELEALRDAETLHMLPSAALAVSIKSLAECALAAIEERDSLRDNFDSIQPVTWVAEKNYRFYKQKIKP
jgi:hypothetical protein